MSTNSKTIGPVTTSAGLGSAASGALAVIAVWLVQLAGLDVPAEVTAAFTVVLGVIGSLIGGWLAPSQRARIAEAVAEVVPSADEIAMAVTTTPAAPADVASALTFQIPEHADQQVTTA